MREMVDEADEAEGLKGTRFHFVRVFLRRVGQ